jgi:hypothetical protein
VVWVVCAGEMLWYATAVGIVASCVGVLASESAPMGLPPRLKGSGVEMRNGGEGVGDCAYNGTQVRVISQK